MKAIPRPNIFEYTDSLLFLRHWCEYLKSQGEPRLSLRDLATIAQLSPAALSLGLNGKQKLSEKSFEKILPHLQLETWEVQFIRILRRISEADSEGQRLQAIDEMCAHPKYIEARKENHEIFSYLSNWHYVLIREMTELSEFKEDPTWIQHRSLHYLSREEIKKALKFLESNGYLHRNTQGKLESSNKNLKCESSVFSASLQHFHQSILQVAEKSITECPKEKRNIQGITIKMSANNFSKINSILENALNEIETICSEQDVHSEEIYHFECALFPLTLSKDKTKN